MTETIKKITEDALALCEREFSYSELFCFLENGNDAQKQICIFKIPCLKSQKDADALIFHLTNQHGTVREAAAEKINELMQTPDSVFFQTDFALEKFLYAVIDVNPNICRLIIDVLPCLSEESTEKFLHNLCDLTLKITDEAEALNVRNRSHVYTKKIFNLYWCLEAIAEIACQHDESIEKIIKKTSISPEYTIREKTAKIIKNLGSDKFLDIFNKLKNDENFYVRFQAGD